jgi:AAA15 family ATPase/GTPase
MLIEFSVANFRSIKERQTLSMATGEIADNNRHVLSTGFNAVPRLNEIAAVYGPNGAGKSNLVTAMDFFQEFVANSSKESQRGESIDIKPFLFSGSTRDKPSEFEAAFIYDGYLFQYGFIVDAQQVHEEWLYATPQGKEKQKSQLWMERNADGIRVKKELKGAKETWKEATRDNALFLSTAVHLNSKDFRKPFEWIRKKFKILPNPRFLGHGFTLRQIDEHGKIVDMLRFMQDFDASFNDVKIVKSKFTEDEIKSIPEFLKQKIGGNFHEAEKIEVFTIHRTEEGADYPLPLDDESQGTRRLFSFAGPILDVLENGMTLVVDELHNSLHPRALQGIVALFQNKDFNRNNAQLIFTTHETSIMDMIGKDQLWLIDKKGIGATVLTAASEFKGRTGTSLEKSYLSGRYGALPVIRIN